MKAIYPGTFDPITVGHLDIIRRSSKIYDEVYVAIMKNNSKKAIFSEEERKEMIEECCKGLPNVKVCIGEGLTVEYAKQLGCKVIIRGIRAVSDYEYELAQATANMMLNSEIETSLLVARPELSFLSSSIAKEIAYFNGDISPYIPSEIYEKVSKRLYKK